MSEDNNTPNIQDEELTPEKEMEILKARAKTLGLKIQGNVSLETMRERVNQALSEGLDEESIAQAEKMAEIQAAHPDQRLELLKESLPPDKASRLPTSIPDPLYALQEHMTPQERRSDLYKKMNKLVRVNITCNNPQKTDYDGEIITVANSLFKFRKFVPFNQETHVPQMILNMMAERQCTVFRKKKNALGQWISDPRQIKEFVITELPPLTLEELRDVAAAQTAAGVAPR